MQLLFYFLYCLKTKFLKYLIKNKQQTIKYKQKRKKIKKDKKFLLLKTKEFILIFTAYCFKMTGSSLFYFIYFSQISRREFLEHENFY